MSHGDRPRRTTPFAGQRSGEWIVVVAATVGVAGCGAVGEVDGTEANVNLGREVSDSPPEGNSVHADETDRPAGLSPAPVSITIAELTAAGDWGEAFDGKLVELTGRVARPGRVDPVSESMIVIVNEDGIGSSVPFGLAVHAHFPLPKSTLRTLAPVQEVTIRGDLRNVSAKVWELHEAELLAAEPSEAVRMSAVELTRPFLDGRGTTFTEMHHEHLLHVTGTVARTVVFERLLAVLVTGAEPGDEPTFVAVLIEPEHFGSIGEPLPDANDLVERNPFPIGMQASFHGYLLEFELAEFTPDGRPTAALMGYPATWAKFPEAPAAHRETTD